MEQKIKQIIKKQFNAKVLDVTPTNGGFSHSMFFVKIDKKPSEVVCRFSNPTNQKELDLRKEIFILKKFSEKGVPTPKIFSFLPSKSLKENDVMILKKIDGIRLDTIWSSLTKQEKIQITEEIGKILKKIHSIKLPKFGRLKEGGEVEQELDFKFKNSEISSEHSDFLRKEFAKHFLEIGKLFSFKEVNAQQVLKIISFIMKNKKEIDYSGKPTLIHGDFMTGHIFVKKENNSYQIVGIIDVEFAEPSSPEFDFVKLHRQGFFEDKELFSALKKGYGEINQKAVKIFRVIRDLEFAQVLIFSGNLTKGNEILNRLENFVDGKNNL